MSRRGTRLHWIMTFLVMWSVIGSIRGQCPMPNEIIGTNEVCPGSQVIYTVTPDVNPAARYRWEMLDTGGHFMTAVNGTQVMIEWPDYNAGELTLRCTIQVNSCFRYIDMNIMVGDDYMRYPFNCFGEVNIPLDNNCEKLILPQHLLTSGVPDCPSTYEVSLSINGEIPVPNPVTIAYIDQVITATVTHTRTGRACESLVVLSDGIAPVLNCENDTTICNDPYAWDPFFRETMIDSQLVGFRWPTVTDNCEQGIQPQPEGFEWIDQFADPLFSAYIVRNWSATDKYGNRSTCMDTIFLRRIQFDEILCPPDTTIACDAPGFDPADPTTAGVPTFMGYQIYPDRTYCEVGIEYSDKIAYHCTGSYTIYRTWLLADLDAPRVTYDTCHQVIEVVDTAGPEILFSDSAVVLKQHPDLYGVPPDRFYKTIDFPTLNHSCLAHGYFPRPIVSDNCSNTDSVVVDFSWSSGHINYLVGEKGKEHLRFDNLSKGKHIITLTARDACHNITIDTLIAVAKDIQPPFIISDRYPVVTLGAISDVTWIDAAVFDEGTWDNCDNFKIYARRADWKTACGVDLCDSIAPFCSDSHYDSLYCAVLNDNKHESAVEAYYLESLRWLCEDESIYSIPVLSGWWYDLIKHATLDCTEQDKSESDVLDLLRDPTACMDAFASLQDFCSKMGFDYREVLEPHANLYEHVMPSLDLISQIGGGWSDQVPFCCEDACTDGTVTVELLAIDASGNVSRQWVEVEVEDKINPEVKFRLPDLEISCYAFNHYYRDSIDEGNWSVFGSYEAFDVTPYKPQQGKTIIVDRLCTEYPGPGGDYHLLTYDTIDHGLIIENCDLIIEETQEVYFEDCGEGWIERHFVFRSKCQSDKALATKATQKIRIFNDCPLRETDIIWPTKDTTVYGCDYVDIITNGPVMKYYDECREIGIHHKDEIIDELYNADSVCTKIIRRWAVIDWCRQSEPYHAEWIGDQKYHYYEFEQIIYVKDTLGPTFSNCNIDTLCIGSSCSATLDRVVEVNDNCTPDHEIKVGWALYRSTSLGYEPFGSGSGHHILAENLPVGTFRLVITATDGCSITTRCADVFEVRDCIKPSPVCLGITTVKLWPVDIDFDGQIDTAVGELWAQDLNVSSYDNCQSYLTDFRIRLAGEGQTDGQGRYLPPDSTSRNIDLGCADVGTIMVELWVLDASGNADFCEVLVEVQGPVEGCSGMLNTLSGRTVDRFNNSLSGISIYLQASSPQKDEAITDENGYYELRSFFEPGKAYHLSAQKEEAYPLDGISTQDLIQMSKHILQKSLLEHPMAKEAADVNQDGKISPLDIIMIRKLILGKVDTLPVGNHLWKFRNFYGDDISVLNPEFQDSMLLNFKGFKFGDVNGDAGQSAARHRRSKEDVFLLSVRDEASAETGWQEIAITAGQDGTLEGLQFELVLDMLAIEEYEIQETSQNIFTEQHIHHTGIGHLRYLAYEQDQSIDVQSSDTLMMLRVKIKEGVRASDIISIGKQINAEAYDIWAHPSPIKLQFKQNSGPDWTVSQNYPNPFRSQTYVTVEMKDYEELEIEVLSIHGQRIALETISLTPGTHQLELPVSALPGAGTYLYVLRKSDKEIIGKMIYSP